METDGRISLASPIKSILVSKAHLFFFHPLTTHVITYMTMLEWRPMDIVFLAGCS
jgi:hypothetical protein